MKNIPCSLIESLNDKMAILYNLISRLNAIPISIQGFPDGAVVKNLPANAEDPRDAGLILGSGRPWSRK